MMVEVELRTIEHYETLLDALARKLEKIANGHDPVGLTLLKSIPGVGRILGLVMLYEIENIARFPRQQDFASYCRLVKPFKESNGKSYGHSGKKIGNAHLIKGSSLRLTLIRSKLTCHRIRPLGSDRKRR